MTAQPKAVNPFYTLLLIVGVAFAITACAYGVMTVQLLDPAAAGAEQAARHPLTRFMAEHGLTLLVVELVVLAVVTFAAIGTDDYWTRRAARKSLSQNSPLAPALREVGPGVRVFEIGSKSADNPSDDDSP